MRIVRNHYYAAAANMFSHDDYTVGWICARWLLPRPCYPNDHNTYTLGRIGNHKIAIACLPSGVYGMTSATTVATQMLSSFGSVRFGLMVGIGGGVPSKETDIRLGDVVVSKPTKSFGGVVQYDY